MQTAKNSYFTRFSNGNRDEGFFRVYQIEKTCDTSIAIFLENKKNRAMSKLENNCEPFKKDTLNR